MKREQPSTVREFLTDEEGTTSVEYAVIVALILLAVIGGVALVGTATRDSFGSSADAMDTAFGN